ncbi:hypothetical protein KDW40_19115 [Burkholderia cenocepacia]|uniref:hypothetical protein n=1 Tax=Burkholderia TaxID=32008 RepID=UPI0005C792C2|nr:MULTISPECIES: hypothetical protein [Burkholderia]MBR8043466.1 hypothetical protein [Burkholderia cenocepacia]MBR8327842.1 hypothetical protein [Burkholderia cenocepacia]
MSNRVLWDGVDLGDFSEEDVTSMRERVRHDWKIYARQAVNVTGVLVRAAAPTVGAFCTVACCLVAVVGVSAPQVLSALLSTISADNAVLMQLSAWLVGWPLIAGIVVGTVRSVASPAAFGYENQFDREIVDRLVRRYSGSESAGMQRSGVTILRG